MGIGKLKGMVVRVPPGGAGAIAPHHNMSQEELSSSSSHSIINLDIKQSIEEQIPMIGGKLITEINLNELQGERPWRKCRTREEIAQYFNYGFDEITFRLYQKLLREEKWR